MRHLLILAGLGLGLLGSGCTPRPRSPLAQAASRNDADTVKSLLTAAGPTAVGADELHDALIWAVRSGAADGLAVLVSAGADVDGRDAGGNHWSPLQHAVHTQQPRAVRALLEWGADPNAFDPGGGTVLFMAADSLDPAMVSLLLDAGADPRAPGPDGRTALTQAVSGGALWDVTDRPLLGGCRTTTVRALLDSDPDLTIPDTPAGHQAIWWARFHDCDEVLALVGARPTLPGQKIVGAVGFIREVIGVPTPKDVLRGKRATGDQSRR